MIAERLRNRNIPYGWPELAEKAADLIERQVEEIAQLRDFIASLENQGDSLSSEVKRLTAERTELIEVLRPFAEQYDSPDENHWITWGDCHRAYDLLKQITQDTTNAR